MNADQRALLIQDFVRRLRPEPRGAFLSLRALALSLGPDVVERVDLPSVTYLRRETPFLVVGAVRTRLMAAFPAEVKVPDPMGRLLRRGEERYFHIESSGDIDAHHQEFVRKAYEAARAATG